MTINGNKQLGWFAGWAGLFILSLAAGIYSGFYEVAAIPFLLILIYTAWQNKNVVFYLLMVCLPFSFEYNFTKELGTDIPTEFLMLVVCFLFFAYWCYRPGMLKRGTLTHPLLVVLAAWLCWMIVAVSFSSQPFVSIKYFLAKGWYLGAFVIAPLIMLKGKKEITMVVKVFIIALAVVTMIILARQSLDDFSFATVNDAVFPFFRNHVNYSAMLVCGIPLMLACTWLSGSPTLKSLVVLITITSLAALFLAYSRGAWLALLTGITGYILIRKKALVISYIVIVIVAVVSLFWIKSGDRYLRYAPDFNTTIFHRDFKEHLVATYKLKDVSTAERFYRWIAGVRMIKDKPLTGYGPNSFYEHYRPYAVPAYKTWVSRNEDQSTVHNYFLLLAIEQGIPGLIFFLVLLGAMLYFAQHLYHRVHDVFYRTVAITTGVILVMITTLNSLSDLIETDKIGSFFFLSLSLLVVVDIHTRSANKKNNPVLQPGT